MAPERRDLLAALEPSAGTALDVEEWADADCTTMVDLHHVHLPLLEEYGFITWDRATGRVTRGPQFQKIGPLLELLAAHADELPGEWPSGE